MLDITPLRTKILEMGQPPVIADGDDGASWVRGRQSTGRIAAISNKATFTDPVFWWELSARFVVELRMSRTVKSELARRIRERFDAEGIEISSATSEVFVRYPEPRD